MTEQTEDQRTLVSLRIEAQQQYEGQLTVQFTGLDAAGASLVGSLGMSTDQLTELRDRLGRVADGTAPAEGGLGYGRPDEPRIVFNLKGVGASLFQFEFIVAYATGQEGYRPDTLRATVSQAALSRLVAGLDQIVQGGQGVVNWVVSQ